jgi:hypothetical protein
MSDYTQAYLGGLLKMAREDLAYDAIPNTGFELAEGIQLRQVLPNNTRKLRRALMQLTDPEKSRSRPVLGYRNVAVLERELAPYLDSLGFKPTRIATPLPGEAPLAKTWRSGKLHLHKQGPVFLAHQDDVDPKAGRLGYLSLEGLKHGVTEGVPSLAKRMFERRPLVREVELEPAPTVV